MKKGILILGSSNSKGETYKIANYISQKTAYEIVDLKTKNITEFDYEFKNSTDDFLPLMEEIEPITNYYFCNTSLLVHNERYFKNVF